MRPNHLAEKFQAWSSTQGVYAIRNTRTGEVYVGSSVHVGTRSRQHFASFDGCRAVREAVKLHGIEAFDLVLLEVVSDESQLGIRERSWTKGLQNLGLSLYNLRPNTTGNRPSTEARLRQSERMRKPAAPPREG